MTALNIFEKISQCALARLCKIGKDLISIQMSNRKYGLQLSLLPFRIHKIGCGQRGYLGTHPTDNGPNTN